MVDDGDQIGVERRRLGRRGRRALQHPEHVGGMAKAGIGRDRRFSPAGADGGGGEDGRGGQKLHGDVDAVTVGEPGHQGADHVQRAAAGQIGVQRSHLGEGLKPRFAQPPAHLPELGQAFDHAVEKEVARVLVGDPPGELVQGEPADDQPARLAVDVGQHRLGGHHVAHSVHVRPPGF